MFFSISCSFFARFSGSAERGERQQSTAQESTGEQSKTQQSSAEGGQKDRGWILRFQQRIHMIWVQLQKRMLRFGSSNSVVYVAKRMYK
jgi:hypothetical protein